MHIATTCGQNTETIENRCIYIEIQTTKEENNKTCIYQLVEVILLKLEKTVPVPINKRIKTTHVPPEARPAGTIKKNHAYNIKTSCITKTHVVS